MDPAEDAATDELELVPAWIDETEEKYGRCLFLTFGGYDESVDSATEDKETEWSRVWGNYSKPAALQTLELGEQEKKAEYYDRIYLGWYDPAQYTVGLLPCPQVEDIEVASDFSGYRRGRFSLRLRGAEGMRAMGLPEIDQSRKSTFSFLADEIPDVRARFLIRGKLYLCAKLTVTLTERGRSRLIKGDFYPVIG